MRKKGLDAGRSTLRQRRRIERNETQGLELLFAFEISFVDTNRHTVDGNKLGVPRRNLNDTVRLCGLIVVGVALRRIGPRRRFVLRQFVVVCREIDLCQRFSVMSMVEVTSLVIANRMITLSLSADVGLHRAVSANENLVLRQIFGQMVDAVRR